MTRAGSILQEAGRLIELMLTRASKISTKESFPMMGQKNRMSKI